MLEAIGNGIDSRIGIQSERIDVENAHRHTETSYAAA
jgi:hypothetical protein